MVDAIGPGRASLIQKIRRIQGDDNKAKTSKPGREAAAPDSSDQAQSKKRKGGFIDEQA